MREIEFMREQLTRQVNHWVLAANRLNNPNDLGSPDDWASLERYLRITLRRTLRESSQRLIQRAMRLQSELSVARTATDLKKVKKQIVEFRRTYLHTETTLDFYADTIATRGNPKIGDVLRVLDSLVFRSMKQVLDRLDQPTPNVLTYIDKGLGALIYKAGLRLWDGGTVNPVAVIKIVRHNLMRPTSLTHEAGHQVAYITRWNQELAQRLESNLSTHPKVGKVWASWSSEIAADSFAFAHMGYAAIASLHDVLSGDDRFVFRFNRGDPHPLSYLRVLLGTAMCRRAYGAGPWDSLEHVWRRLYPLSSATTMVHKLVKASLPLLSEVVETCLYEPMASFGNRPLVELVNPERVSPIILQRLESELGDALYQSTHWLWTEALRLIALNGLKVAIYPEQMSRLYSDQQDWILKLSNTLKTA